MLGRTDQHGSETSGDAPTGARVLVVDDCSDTAHVCGRMLRLAGFEVAVALGGFEALRIASEFEPHIALLDIGLADIDGFEVARRLRTDARFKTMMLIAFTGFASDEARAKAKDVGFNYFLVKPVPFADVLSLLVNDTVGRTDPAHASTNHPPE
jgi:CheY-like chemotaxis protein